MLLTLETTTTSISWRTDSELEVNKNLNWRNKPAETCHEIWVKPIQALWLGCIADKSIRDQWIIEEIRLTRLIIRWEINPTSHSLKRQGDFRMIHILGLIMIPGMQELILIWDKKTMLRDKHLMRGGLHRMRDGREIMEMTIHPSQLLWNRRKQGNLHCIKRGGHLNL